MNMEIPENLRHLIRRGTCPKCGAEDRFLFAPDFQCAPCDSRSGYADPDTAKLANEEWLRR